MKPTLHSLDGRSAEQIEFPSLMFPEDRKMLKPAELAPLLRISERHILDLLEEGKMIGIDAAGRHEFIRLPICVLDHLAKVTGVKKETLLAIIQAHKPTQRTSKSLWRVPVEGWRRYLQENSSLAK